MFNIRYTRKAEESLASIKPELDAREHAIDLLRDRSVAHLIGMQMRRRGQHFPSPDAEVLVEMEPSTRQYRRLRRRDSAATARKSRRNAFRRRTTEHQVEQNFRGQARVYFGLSPDASDAMHANVVGAVHDLVETLAVRDDIPVAEALERVEKRMQALLEDYGDLEVAA